MSYLTEDAIMVAIQMGAVTWTLRSPDSSDWQEWNRERARVAIHHPQAMGVVQDHER
jgi:hypothetical protein